MPYFILDLVAHDGIPETNFDILDVSHDFDYVQFLLNPLFSNSNIF